MAALSGNLSLIDIATRMEKDSVARNIIELLNERNEVLEDMSFMECNDGSTHKTTVRTGIPEGTWRLLNYGVEQKKSTTAQIKDSCGMLENYSTVDVDIIRRAKDQQALRLSEDKPFIEGMGQQVTDTLFYGNTATNPERFMGLAPRYNALSGIESAENIINGGGSGSDNCSIWLIVWGENSIHGLYPSGSQAGLHQEDLGKQTVYDANNNPYQAYRTHFKWDVGLTVRDWRQAVRIANIDVSELTKNASAGADLVDLMVQATERVHSLNAGKPVFYCNRTIRSFLRRQIVNKSNLLLSLDQVAGKSVLNFDGIPVKRCDSLVSTEAALT